MMQYYTRVFKCVLLVGLFTDSVSTAGAVSCLIRYVRSIMICEWNGRQEEQHITTDNDENSIQFFQGHSKVW
jgi:hypothetical protein